MAGGVTERALQMLHAQLQFMQQFSEGIDPTNLQEVREVEGLEPEELFYAELNVDEHLVILKEM